MDHHPLTKWRERQEPKMNKRALARLLEVSPASITRWETGKRQPGARVIRKIIARTGIAGAGLRPDWAKLLKAMSP